MIFPSYDVQIILAFIAVFNAAFTHPHRQVDSEFLAKLSLGPITRRFEQSIAPNLQLSQTATGSRKIYLAKCTFFDRHSQSRWISFRRNIHHPWYADLQVRNKRVLNDSGPLNSSLRKYMRGTSTYLLIFYLHLKATLHQNFRSQAKSRVRRWQNLYEIRRASLKRPLFAHVHENLT